MTLVPYIYFIRENGFIVATKFIKEVDLETLKQGQKITSFYDETYPLYNIFSKNTATDKYSMFIDGQLTSLSQDQIIDKIKISFPLLLNQIASSKIVDLLHDYTNLDGTKRGDSEFSEYLNTVEQRIGVKFEIVIEEFSLKKYTSLANELQFLSDCLDPPKIAFAHFIKRSIQGFNTFLANDGIVKNYKHGLFSTYMDDETEENYVSFSEASQTLRAAADSLRYDNTISFTKKETPKKLKM